VIKCSDVDPHHFDEDPDADPHSTYHPDADPDPDPSFQIKAQTLEKKLKYAHIPYILACHLQIDADLDLDPAYHFDADPDAVSDFDFLDADSDPDFYLMRIRTHNAGKMCN
jgi:hypothetical protein